MRSTREFTELLFKGFAEGSCRDPPGLQTGYDPFYFLFADRWPTQRQKLFSYLHSGKSSIIGYIAVVWRIDCSMLAEIGSPKQITLREN